MPQVDLVSVCSGANRKIACESTDLHPDVDGDSDQDQPELPPDFPPESFWLSKDAELEWLDRNAFFDRKDSTKGTNSNSANLNPSLNPSSSQRFSLNLKSKASIIGLPKPHKSCFVGLKNRRTCNTRLFPKPDASVTEPSSPKVSCIGRVRSKTDRNRRLRNRSAVPEPEKSRRRKSGLLAAIGAIFRTRCRGGELDAPRVHTLDVHDIRNRLPADAPPRKSVTPPGLGGMQRFASGRRSGSWGVDDEVAQAESSDRDSV